jgi:ABC-type lipoprotein release transport system permease subunit
VLRTLGFTQLRVLSIFASESVALSVSGGVLGVLATIPVITVLTHGFIGLGIPINMKVRFRQRRWPLRLQSCSA